MPNQFLSLEDVQSVLPGGPNLALPSLTPPAKPAAPAPGALSLSDVQEVVPQPLSLSDIDSVVTPPAKEGPHVYTLDEVKAKTGAELAADKDFSPVEFSKANEAAIQQDPNLLQKVTEAYQTKETNGTTMADKIKALVTGIPVAGKAILGGVKNFAEHAYELNPVALAARAAGAATSGAPVGEALKAEGKKALGQAAEVPASLETAAVNTSDLIRRSGRAVKEGVGKVLPGVSSKAELTPEEWRNRLFNDVAGAKQAEAAGKGNGEVAKALGYSADELSKVGINLDPEAIQELSVVTDPVNYIPLGGAIGVVGKFAGKFGTKIIGTALTAEQAARAAELLNTASQAAAGVSEVSQSAAGKAVGAVGGALEAAGNTVDKGVRALGGAGTGFGLGALIGSSVPAAFGGVAAAKAAGPLIRAAGRGVKAAGEIISGARPVPGAISSVAGAVTGGAKAVGEGLLLGIPFELGARPEEEQGILGGAGLGGVLHGVAHVGGDAIHAAGRAAQDALAERIYKQVDQAPAPESATYGTDHTLDSLHAATIDTLDPRSQKLINWTRELFRDSGIEVYALPEKDFARETGHDSAYGFKTTVGESIGPDGQARPLVRLLLDSSSEATPHELFHGLAEVDPKASKELIDAVQKAWTPEQQKTFSDIYNTALNRGRPESQWTRRYSPEKIAEEAAAEVFSRVYLAQDLQGVSTNVRQKAAIFVSQLLEKLGAPLGQIAKPGTAGKPGVSTLGVRPSANQAKAANQYLSGVLQRLSKEGTVAESGPSKLTGGATPADITTSIAPSGPAPKPSAPPAPTPGPAPVPPRPPGQRPVPAPAAPVQGPRNIRVTPEHQNRFSAQRAADLKIKEAKDAATKQTPEVQGTVEKISNFMENGNPVLEIEHSGVKTPSSSASPNARTARRAEQEAAYIAEGLGAAPESIRDAYQKVFVPARWEVVGGKPQLIAMSLDKVIANVHRLAEDVVSAKAESLFPYEIVDGKLTENAWGQIVDDVQAYAENQSNGYRGDGQKLVRPTEDIGVSIPGENSAYNPTVIPEDRANTVNVLMGIAPPLTARETGKGIPGNVKGQLLAEANKRTPQTPSVIRPEDIQKQTFKSGREVKETNPLRNELAAAGVPVRELLEVTERVNAADISNVKPRTDLNFKAPVTDTIRGGFLPKPGKETYQAVREGFLPDPNPSKPTPSEDIRNLASDYAKSAGIDYKPARAYGALDPNLSKRIADFYESAKSTPEDSKVQASYQALADEVMAQYRSMEAAGYKIEPFTGEGEPYKSSADAVKDIRDNKHLYFLQTDKAFGRGTNKPTSNPMLRDSGVVINGERLPVNDVFRAVHDFFGHGKEGYQFGPRGEFNAWRAHSEMFSPEAQGALAAETLAQNSWVNFGKHLRDEAGNIPGPKDPGYVRPADRPFGEQKNVIVPQELIDAARKEASKDPAFLPKPGQSVESFSKEVIDWNAEEMKKNFPGGVTRPAWELGSQLKDKTELEHLRQAQAEVKDRAAKALEADDFDQSYVESNKALFFREAIESATNTGSAKTARAAGRFDLPAPLEEKGSFLPGREPSAVDKEVAKRLEEHRKLGNPTTDTLKKKVQMQVEADQRAGRLGKAPEGPVGFFLPKTEAGKALAKEGFDFEVVGQKGIRSVTVMKDGVVIGEIMSVQRRPGVAEIANAQIKKSVAGEKISGRGVGEAAYRELLTKLKEDGVTKIEGMVVAPQPLAIRRKIFNDKFSKLELNAEPTDIETAIKAADDLQKGSPDLIAIEAENTIEPDQSFLPKKKKVEENPYEKYNTPAKSAKSAEGLTGWIEPDSKFKVLKEGFHENYLADNADALNQKYGTDFSGTPDIKERHDALNKGFVRFRLDQGGTLNVEANAKRWPAVKRMVTNKILDSIDNIDKLRVSLLNNDGQVVDSTSARLFDAERPEDAATQALSELRATNLRDAALPKVPTKEEITDALSSDKKPFVHANRDLEAGTPIGVRIDIPAFMRTGTYVQTVHESASGGQVGKRIGYDNLVTVDNPKFFSNEKGAAKIRDGAAKFPIATVEGEYNPSHDLPQDLSGYTAVGYNPKKHSYFYEKGTDRLVEGGSQAVSVGNTVYVKDPVFGNVNDAAFLPKADRTPEEVQKDINKNAKHYVAEARKFPEAIVPKPVLDENGNVRQNSKGEPLFEMTPPRFDETPVAVAAAKGIRNLEERVKASKTALANNLVKMADAALKDPAVAVGKEWYNLAQKKIGSLFGEDAGFFAELLGATSARTQVPDNFRQSIDAYNRFKAGKFDAILEKYREGKAKFAAGDIADFLSDPKNAKNPEPDRGQYLKWWIDTHNLKPIKSNGTLYNANSVQVLKVLDRSWKQEVGGPKTPNFADNLSGVGHEATIDVWAARALIRAGNEGNTKRWRETPRAEGGVTDDQFFYAQDVFRQAAERLGMKPQELQAILWFGEKDLWGKKGWTSEGGKKKTDFHYFLDRTEKTSEGLKINEQDPNQPELDLGVSSGDIKKKAA